jgi:MGT family glycosyltransferase
MPKALFLSLPLHGHVNPSLPLVRALVERGEEVVYVSSEPFAARIQQAGARYRPYRNAFLADPGELSEHTDKISWLLMRTTSEVLADDLDAFRAERPDYIISDSLAPWGQWVGEVLDVPVVTSVATVAVNRHVLALAASRGTRPKSARLVLSKIQHVAKAALLGRRLRRAHGVKGTGIMGLMLGGSGLNIVYTSRYFQPCPESFDHRFLFVGPSIGSRNETADSSDFSPDQASQTDAIYVSLGTLFNRDPAFYRNCFEAFGGLDVRVIMAIGCREGEGPRTGVPLTPRRP